MIIAKIAAAGAAFACWTLPAHAQVPYVIGTWEFNAEQSRVPGPPPQKHTRVYYPGPDGVLIGVAVIVDAQGWPTFLQFAARPDGMDYPEFTMEAAARYLIDGTAPGHTYSETPIDSHRVRWVDKLDGHVTASGEKWVSEDGQTLSFTVAAPGEAEILYVFDRTSP